MIFNETIWRFVLLSTHVYFISFFHKRSLLELWPSTIRIDNGHYKINSPNCTIFTDIAIFVSFFFFFFSIHFILSGFLSIELNRFTNTFILWFWCGTKTKAPEMVQLQKWPIHRQTFSKILCWKICDHHEYNTIQKRNCERELERERESAVVVAFWFNTEWCSPKPISLLLTS